MTALYEVEIRHTRYAVMRRTFRHRSYLWLVDLDALPRLPAWQRPFARFAAADHLGDPRRSIRENIDRYLARHGVELAGGRVLMLANARGLGHVFNPLTVYWCHHRDGALACVIAEVHNTYGERHRYLLRTDDAGRAGAAKEFYVSPFLTVDGEYRMHLPLPDDRLSLTITLRQRGSTAFAASVVGSRRPAGPASLARLLVRYPLVTRGISARIRRHGIALWLRRLPIVPRPSALSSEGVP